MGWLLNHTAIVRDARLDLELLGEGITIFSTVDLNKHVEEGTEEIVIGIQCWENSWISITTEEKNTSFVNSMPHRQENTI
jgi:hypothetical protein